MVTIENTEMQIREFNGQRVVTFKDIDLVHQRKAGTARNTFNRNKKRFVLEEDYFVCKTYEAKDMFGMFDTAKVISKYTLKDNLSFKDEAIIIPSIPSEE